MIEINLLPPELHKQTPKMAFPVPKLNRSDLARAKQYFILFALILAGLHVLLLTVTLYKQMQAALVSKQLQHIKPAKERVDALKTQMGEIENKAKTVEQLTTGDKVIWSEKLNILSDVVPSGIWLNKLFLSGGSFEIEGSAVSKKADEMLLVGQFVTNLKKEQRFFKDFNDIAIDSIKRRNIAAAEIADFIIKVPLKKNSVPEAVDGAKPNERRTKRTK